MSCSGTTDADQKHSSALRPNGSKTDYVIEAWHERLGTQTQNVTIGEGATAELNFTFGVS